MRVRLLSGLCLALVLSAGLGGGVSWGQAGSGRLTVSVIDVGQGDSIWIEYPNGKHMLIDAGPAGAEAKVLAFLRAKHTARLDALVVSHFDADHIGGMVPVIKSAGLQISELWEGRPQSRTKKLGPVDKAATDKGATRVPRKAGMELRMGDVTVDVLGPSSYRFPGKNNNSVVLRLTYGEVSFLFPGDMEGPERTRLGKTRCWSHADVLKVAHHGSANGTDCTFAQQVSPRYAVMSYALQNRPYFHPQQEAINALTLAHAKLYGTAPNGTVTFTTDGVTLDRPITTRTGSVAAHPGREKLQCPSAAEKQAVGLSPALCKDLPCVGSKRTKVFHLASCPKVRRSAKTIALQSRQEALKRGYRACDECTP